MFAVLGCRAVVSTQKYYYDSHSTLLEQFFSILQISTVQV
jgi:hypothetical protein